MTSAKRLLLMALASLLAACATPPTTGPKQVPATASPTPTPPAAATSQPQPESVTPPTTPVDTTNVWDKLRGSFAMSDCDADPQIMVWAHRYTQNPQRFEAQMDHALSQLIYVQQMAEKYNVAGEFVLLPWVESQYQPVPGHRNLPAGMWQIVPSTAHVLGLHLNRSYDGRLDTSASSDGVMRMLRDYYNELHDWRLVDYAFNRGEYGIQRLVQQHGVPPEEPAIPRLPVPRITREHLTKLLAISCVIRDPSRFNVSLPTLPADQHLETVEVSHGMTLSGAANNAGMAADTLKRLNPAVNNDMLDANTPHLLMPHRNAEQLRNAMQIAGDQGMMASTSGPADPPASFAFADKSADDQDSPASAAPSHKARTHTVRSGESLWQIARNYSISVSTLQRLNNLHGKALKPGQVLKLDAP